MQIKLSEIPTKAPKELEKDFIKAKTAEILNDIKKLQDILIASKKNALLVILQGMDASGKDGVTKNVFGALNPLGINVAAFKKPTEEEMAHDFLWRVHKVVPSKGNITIFNRSHYEDVLIQRVHHWVDEKTIKNRFEAINDFETLLEQTGTKIIKCFLHISEDEQLERLQERKTNPEKMWKHNDGDWEERKLWKQYQNAYEDVFENCSKAAKWHIIQTDQNWYKEYLIADLVKNTLEDMHLEYPLLNSK